MSETICSTFWGGPRIAYVDDGHGNEVEYDFRVSHDCSLAAGHEGTHQCRCGETLEDS
jgi:hypothetical protein